MSDQDRSNIPAFWCRLYPELRYFKSREELRDAKRQFLRSRVLRRWYLLFPVLLLLVVSIPGGAVFTKSLLVMGLPAPFAVAINTACFAFVGMLVFMSAWRRPYVRFVRQYLQDRGVPVCLKCGYDLRGQTAPRCPECGHAFDPKLMGSSRAKSGLAADEVARP